MAQAFETSGFKRNGAARNAMKSRANDVLEDIDELRKDVNKLADAAGKYAREEVMLTGDRIKHARDVLGARAKDGLHTGTRYLGEQVRERPAAAIGVSLGLGLLLGLACAPRGHRN